MRKLNYVDKGNAFDFGRISKEYGEFRDVYPDEFFEKFFDLGLCGTDKVLLDLGTGTGVLPRHLKKYGGKYIGADISYNQIAQAKELSKDQDITYIVSPAEEVRLPSNSLDTVTACMCFTYFDKKKLLPNIHNMLKDNGKLAVMSMIWLPKESEIAHGSEELILKYNPAWNGNNYDRPKYKESGIPFSYDIDTDIFELDTAFDFDVSIEFTRESWHGRIKAARGIGASSISRENKESFEAEHKKFLEKFPEKFEILHSVTFCVMKKK